MLKKCDCGQPLDPHSTYQIGSMRCCRECFEILEQMTRDEAQLRREIGIAIACGIGLLLLAIIVFSVLQGCL